MTADPSGRHPDDGDRPSAIADGRVPVMAVESIRKTYQDLGRRRGGPTGDDSGSVTWGLDRGSMASQR